MPRTTLAAQPAGAGDVSECPPHAAADFRPFIRCAWRDLAVVNYAADVAALAPHVPPGVELAHFDGRLLVSLVAFRFRHVRVAGLPIPTLQDFCELNLRFYVRRRTAEGWRQGVVFVRELAPPRLLAWGARWLYGERYLAVPMRRRVEPPTPYSLAPARACYSWLHAGRWQSLSVEVRTPPRNVLDDPHARDVLENYAGYARCRDGRTVEYAVAHPAWQFAPAEQFAVDCEARALYGAALGEALASPPMSAFFVNGSTVTIGWPRKI